MVHEGLAAVLWRSGAPWLALGALLGVAVGGAWLMRAPAAPRWLSFSEVYDAVAPSVVNVAVGGPEVGIGSGFAVGPNKVVTARHLVSGAQDIAVRDLDGKEYAATLLGSDSRTDLALLDVPDASLVPIVLGRSALLEVGDTVLAIGNPYGLGHSLAQGLVGGRQRAVDGDSGEASFLQLSIPLNPGNSGGPVVDERGRVVGVLAGTHAQGQAIAFAVPSDALAAVLPALLRGDHLTRAWLGLRGSAGAGELLVDAVVVGGPADRAGLRVGDRLLAVAGMATTSPEDMVRALDRVAPFGKVELTVRRDGVSLSLPVVVDDRSARTVVASGMTLRAAPGAGGEVVVVRDGSRAHRAGVVEGDIVRVVGGYVVQSPADVQDLLAGQGAVQLEVMRTGSAVRITLEPLRLER